MEDPTDTLDRTTGIFLSSGGLHGILPSGPHSRLVFTTWGHIQNSSASIYFVVGYFGAIVYHGQALATTPGPTCVLCQEDVMESHEHLFFMCSYATRCILAIRRVVSFHWPYSSWPTVIRWASVRWRGKHVVCVVQSSSGFPCIHLWRERNLRIFQHTTRTAEDIARTVVSDIRDLIICKQLPSSVSTRGLYRIWRIPWPIEGEART
ncbi:UNVERIFIED_CONTAM: hypothetical protein Sradi_7183300 [Sesamum radiatum]|uniref:Reverse transcriptase zinc-binding domain-containing protein n=1 Tax=Sesamum radiatum TaxID=300843 RepID=A0AAW2ISD3_SESRA